jgi:hypothetical protein
MSDGPNDAADVPMSFRTKVLAGVVGVILLLGAAYLMLRMSSPMIPAGKTPPPDHFSLRCTICHRVSVATTESVTP